MKHQLNQLRETEGFTLLGLLIVIAIVSILSAIAVPQLNAYKRGAFIDEVKMDLKNAVLFQEAFFIDNETYTSSVSTLTSSGFRQNAQVALSITVGGAANRSVSQPRTTTAVPIRGAFQCWVRL
jgi:prepilin-type N-terminal cleavage/methylation domain-containing protein